MKMREARRVAFTVFTTLLLLADASLSPPRNLQVTCDNLRVLARWDHSDDQPGTSFLVTFKPCTVEDGGAKETLRQTQERELDLSSEVSGSLERLLTLYEVKVAAQRNGLLSDSTPQVFSFNWLKLPGRSCDLDFPPLNVSIVDQQLVVTFFNPLHYYEALHSAPDAELAMTYYVLEYGEAQFNWTCPSEQWVCGGSVPLQDDCCVTLKHGFLFKDHRHATASVRFRDSPGHCDDCSAADNLIATLAILLVALVVIAIVLTLVVFKVKAWTLRPSQLPKVLTPPLKFPVVWSGQNLTYNPVHPVPTNLKTLILYGEEGREMAAPPPSAMAERRVDLGDGEPATAYSELRSATFCAAIQEQRTACKYIEGAGLESEEDLEASVYDRPHCPVEGHVLPSQPESRSPTRLQRACTRVSLEAPAE